ncbi:MAG TPA: hypothetical protein DEH78_19085 [Solibacterales bacterium]|nr:hypothetical protein [Bryobacterales bacterium]
MLRGRATYATCIAGGAWVLLYVAQGRLGLAISKDTFETVLSLLGFGVAAALRRGMKKEY